MGALELCRVVAWGGHPAGRLACAAIIWGAPGRHTHSRTPLSPDINRASCARPKRRHPLPGGARTGTPSGAALAPQHPRGVRAHTMGRPGN